VVFVCLNKLEYVRFERFVCTDYYGGNPTWCGSEVERVT
jgi:hypothetical protein